jgi:cell division protein FtsZ
METISRSARPQAEVLFGTVIDPKMDGRVEITLIATGTGSKRRPVAPAEQPQQREKQPAPVQEEQPSQSQVERLALAEILGDDLAVPAFMRSRRRRVRVEGVGIV